MAIGDSNGNQIFFLDFAFSKIYVNDKGEPKRREETIELCGTPQYMPKGPLKGLTHVRKDDFISFGIVLLELNGVRLPWTDKIDDDDDIEVAMDVVLGYWKKNVIKVSTNIRKNSRNC